MEKFFHEIKLFPVLCNRLWLCAYPMRVNADEAGTAMKRKTPSEPRPARKVSELADAMRCHPVTVYRLIARGKIAVTRLGAGIRIPHREFERLVHGGGDAA